MLMGDLSVLVKSGVDLLSMIQKNLVGGTGNTQSACLMIPR